jgi:hypothetical protein
MTNKQKLTIQHDHTALSHMLEQRDALNTDSHEHQHNAYIAYPSLRNHDLKGYMNMLPCEHATDLAALSGNVAELARIFQFNLNVENCDKLRTSLIETGALVLFWIDELQKQKEILQKEEDDYEKGLHQ